MSAKGKKPLVPKLRFAEFRDAGEWKVKEIREVGNIVTGKTPNTKDDNLWNGNILFITPTDIHEQAKYQISTQRKVVETKETKLLPPGSILYTCIASIGKIAITKDKSISNQQINSIITNSKNNNEFIYYCLLHLTPWIKSIPAVSTLPIINKQEFSKIKIRITPNKKEQQKIAACLTALDDLISATTGRLDALKQHKQGLMQQLFPTEGETVPRLRFAEFRDAGEWKVKEIREVGNIVTGKTPNTKDDNLWNGNILFITPTDIHEQAKYQISTQRKVVETKETKLLPPGSILYTCIASIGKIAITKDKSISNQQINSIITNSKNNNEFIYYCLLHLTPWIKSIPAVSTLPIINKQEFSKIKIRITPNKKEQQKIAACLTALDDLIAAQTQKIAKLKTHKRGLMQQLFPAVDETHR